MSNRVRLLTVPDDGRAELRRWPRARARRPGSERARIVLLAASGLTRPQMPGGPAALSRLRASGAASAPSRGCRHPHRRGVVAAVRNDPSGIWSRAVGFGFQKPVTGELVSEICDFFRSGGTPQAAIQLAPAAIPEDWPDTCVRLRLSPGPAGVKLACAADSAVIADPGSAGLRAGVVESGQAAEWASVMTRGFGMPGRVLYEAAVASVGRPGW